jgi:hypothetical protein
MFTLRDLLESLQALTAEELNQPATVLMEDEREIYKLTQTAFLSDLPDPVRVDVEDLFEGDIPLLVV